MVAEVGEPGAEMQLVPATRSVLFAPGNHARRVEKALLSTADAVVLDLEDAVPEPEKARAREIVADALAHRQRGPRVYVRINALASTHWEADLELVRSRPEGLVVPKAEEARQLFRLDGYLAALERGFGCATNLMEVMPIIETARGVQNCAAVLAASSRIRRAIFGAADYTLDLNIEWSADEAALAFARAALVHASRVAEKEPPIDTATLQVRDLARFRESACNGRRFGMQGKLCLHPDQIEPCHDVFAPSSDELERAERIVAAFANAQAAGTAAAMLDGNFIDLPVALQAQRLLLRAKNRLEQGLL